MSTTDSEVIYDVAKVVNQRNALVAGSKVARSVVNEALREFDAGHYVEAVVLLSALVGHLEHHSRKDISLFTDALAYGEEEP